ncbi:MAG: hypothetical protein Kow00121_01120 [Elainellaceae cyanobacterium]
MSEEFLDLSFTDREIVVGDRTSSGREAVRILLLGKPDYVQQVIQELHVCRFCEVGLWSKPLRISDHQHQLHPYPGEVMRIYKRYVTR